MNACHFIWPLSGSAVPDEMNTSYGPRIDADRWDFHDGIDLPAPAGTPVRALADGVVHRAGPADKTAIGLGFGSTHIVLQVRDPLDGQDDLFLVYLHLDSIAKDVIAGAHVQQGAVIGAVGQEDATYPHLHFEFRKGAPREENSVHPLRYLPYSNTANFTGLRVDRCNFSRVDTDERRSVRLRFEVPDRRQGDLQGVDVEVSDQGSQPLRFHVDFDDRATVNSDKGDAAAFKNGIAVEGYQKSPMKADGLADLHYGVILENIPPPFTSVKFDVVDVRRGRTESPTFALPALADGSDPVDSRTGFEGQTFPPPSWTVHLVPGNICRPDVAAALTGAKGLLCQDLGSAQGPLIRAAMRFALPDNRSVRPMSWRIRADIQPAALPLSSGQVIHPLAFLKGDEVVGAACLRKTREDEFVAGVMVRSADGLFRERIDVNEGKILTDQPVRWELELLRLGTRQTTALVRLAGNVVARIDGDTTSAEPDAGCVGIMHAQGQLHVTLFVDQVRLTEEPQ